MADFWLTYHLIRADVTFPLGLLIAAGVTWHVLLRKREVASAVGWIGLAWFAPVTGAVVYFIFGVNRVQRRARRLRSQVNRRSGSRSARASPGDDGHLDPLERGVGQITGRQSLSGNAIQIYHDGDEAYPPMLAAIAAAKHSVGLSSYIFDHDQWGGRFIAALDEANARGVMVRVLIDGIGGGWLRSPHLPQSPPPGGDGRTLPALAVALADAVPQPALAQEGPRRGRPGRLHRRHEHLR